ncbi:unnamed protein product [Prorocentrum cordatum]|uniref:Uncharacterized protein n=1 Tax=Prorocentrum cordatum TaxID=2364126 RepID=A0ABN9W0M4_9DINO|nr:unnamed protein product [Polarella glacialis]
MAPMAPFAGVALLWAAPAGALMLQAVPAAPGPCRTAVWGDPCYKDSEVKFAMNQGLKHNPQWYANLSAASTFEEFQAFLHGLESHRHTCPEPCPSAPTGQLREAACRTALPGEACHAEVTWAMREDPASSDTRTGTRRCLPPRRSRISSWSCTAMERCPTSAPSRARSPLWRMPPLRRAWTPTRPAPARRARPTTSRPRRRCRPLCCRHPRSRWGEGATCGSQEEHAPGRM